MLGDCTRGRFFQMSGWHRVRVCVVGYERIEMRRNVRQDSDMD